MNPLKIFLNSMIKPILRFQESEDAEQNHFDHPDIRAMDLRQLADLPMPYLPAATATEIAPQQGSIELPRCA